ncbi:MAG: hypothetical protein ACLSF2_09530 [Butyricicoccus sp.]
MPPVMYTLINAIRKYLFVQPVIAAAMRISALKTVTQPARGWRTDWSTRFCGSYGKPLIIVASARRHL